MKPAILFMIFYLISVDSFARDYSRIYSQEEMKAAHAIYSDNIKAVLYEDLAAYLMPAELQSLKRVKLLQSWKRMEDPFEFAANSQTGEIIVPTFSIKFLDDLSVAYAWYERHACDKATLEDYVVALDYSDLPLKAPLATLGIPDNAYKLDHYVNDVSQKILKDAVAFLLLHELAHVHFKHKSYDLISAKEAQQQETEADQFALSVYRRMHSPPMGITVWFTMVAYRDPQIAHSPAQTHPLTASRLRMISKELQENPRAFISHENRDKLSVNSIQSIASNIETIAVLLEKPQLREFIRYRGEHVTLQLLQQGCSAKQQENWMELFKKLTD